MVYPSDSGLLTWNLVSVAPTKIPYLPFARREKLVTATVFSLLHTAGENPPPGKRFQSPLFQA